MKYIFFYSVLKIISIIHAHWAFTYIMAGAVLIVVQRVCIIRMFLSMFVYKYTSEYNWNQCGCRVAVEKKLHVGCHILAYKENKRLCRINTWCIHLYIWSVNCICTNVFCSYHIYSNDKWNEKTVRLHAEMLWWSHQMHSYTCSNMIDWINVFC